MSKKKETPQEEKDRTIGEKLIELDNTLIGLAEHRNEILTFMTAALQEINGVLKDISLQIGAVGELAVEKQDQEPRPKFTPQEYNSLPWNGFTTKKNQRWERFDLAADCGACNVIKENLAEVCRDPEATISAPAIVYDFGYWVFRDWIYRREMKNPAAKK